MQYFTGLPVLLVGLHLVGSCVVWVAAVRLWLLAARRPTQPHRPTSRPAGRTDAALAAR